MPVTLRYADDTGNRHVLAAVFNSVEEAEAQAKHDMEVLGRVPLDIIDGVFTDPHNEPNPTVLVSNTKLKKASTGKAKQWPPPPEGV